jgi:glucose-1-phosphate adenylyltransferase
VDILAAEQTPESIHWFRGTADAVRQTLRHVLGYNVKYILVLAGDQLFRLDFRKMLEQHVAKKADISVCVIPVEEEKAAGFGILKMEANGRMTAFHEKPRDTTLLQSLRADAGKESGVTPERPFLASMGIYLFHTEILVDILKDERKLDFGRDIIPAALNTHSVCGYIFNGYWEDIGTIGAFYRANLGLASARPQFSFYDSEFPIYTHPRFLPPSRLEDCRIQNCIVSEGCSLHDARLFDSVIGIRTMVGRGAEITTSLVMGADYYDDNSSRQMPLGIGANTHVRNAIIDKNARIGRSVRIENERGLREADGPNYYIREGITIIPKNAVIEDGTVI